MRTMMALLLTATLAFAAENLERKLELKVSLDVTMTPLHEVIDQLRDATGLNFVVAEGGETQVSIKVRELRVRSLLDLLLKPRHLTATWEGGAVVIRNRRCNRAAYSVRIYDVRGATAALRDFPAREVCFNDETLCCFAMPLPEEPRALVEEDVLAMLIRSHAGEPGSWESPESSLSIRNGMMIVRQTADVHRQVGTLLRKLGL